MSRLSRNVASKYLIICRSIESNLNMYYREDITEWDWEGERQYATPIPRNGVERVIRRVLRATDTSRHVIRIVQVHPPMIKPLRQVVRQSHVS